MIELPIVAIFFLVFVAYMTGIIVGKVTSREYEEEDRIRSDREESEG